MTPRLLLRALTTLAAVGFGLVSYAYLTLPDVRPLAASNPTRTAFMELRAREAVAKRRPVRRVQHWIPYSRISPHLKRAVLMAEDSAFWEHEGIDVEQIRQSIHDSLDRGAAPRGASTITQQLAKNLYLSPSRDPFRKLREVVIARRLEVALSKRRIFEIYLNVIEWGDQIWGAEAAAQTYFGVSAASLSPPQAALLAGAIVNPRVLNPARPTRRLIQRQRMILARMGSTQPPAPVTTSAPNPDTAPGHESAAPPRVPLTIDEEEGDADDELEHRPETASPPAETPPA